MDGIDVLMKDIGAEFIFFSFHVEDEHLASAPYLEKGAAKV